MHPPWTTRSGRRGHRERQSIPPLGQARDDGQASLKLEIYLARHGETAWSLSGRHTGSTDLSLTPHGEQQAAALKKRLENIQFDAVYSSPLQRATRTAELAGFPNPQLTPLLREVDYGQYEGMTTTAIRELQPGWELYKDGCPGGESPDQMYARAVEFLNLFTAVKGRVVAFSHGHFLRLVAAAWMRLDVKAAASLYLDVATLSILREDDDHGRVLAVWNAP
ncbi:MAG: histidine phosphatase family protein [Candidatus Dormibacteraeota bacterium]|nr:histidine phosphatase family protein [Candidatus Dormibacteraeota bacterium]